MMYSIKGMDLFTKRQPGTAVGKVVQFPLVRMAIVFLFFLPIFRLHSLVAAKIIGPSAEPLKTVLFFLDTLVAFALVIVVYRLYTKWVENRKAIELSGKKALGEFGTGFGVSFVLIGLILLILLVPGYYKIESLNSYYLIVVQSFFLFGMKAFIEELLFRLILFKLSEELLGSWLALALVTVLFGLAHLGNPNATLGTSLAVAIIGGLFDTAAFMYTRRVWFALGIHMSWNYFQAGIFGMPSSGISHESLIRPAVQGPELLTGGAFGVEMSIPAILLCLIASFIILNKAIKNKQIIQPLWIRKRNLK
jgi:membrane protease YdiL (CAAX protease family)